MHRLLSASALAALALAPAAGGTPAATSQAGANVKAGKALFVGVCGGCHTFAPAGTKGRKGPNLAEEPQSFGEIVEQIRNGGGGMPAFRKALRTTQIRNIAAFVVHAAPATGARDE
jgi:mono/diheme cytochrome c family protein